MGNTIGIEIKQVQKIRIINHCKMKNIKLLNNNQIIRCNINIEHEQEFIKWEQQLLKLNNYDEYYLLLPKAYSFQKKSICGSSGMLKIDFDNYPFLLHDEIRNRMITNNYFSQIELWYLLYGLVSATKAFGRIESKVGDIQAKNIFINEEGQVKISNVCSWPSELTNYQKLVLEHIPTYVAPEELQWVKDGRVNIYNNSMGKCDKYLCQSFSIGLTMLESLLLNPSIKLYTCQGSVFDYQELDRRLTKMVEGSVKSKYSTELKIAVFGLCQIKPSDRFSASQLYDILKQHDSQLTNLKLCKIVMPDLRNKQKYDKLKTPKSKPDQNKINFSQILPPNLNQKKTKPTNNTQISSINNNIKTNPRQFNQNSSFNSYLSTNQYYINNKINNPQIQPIIYKHNYIPNNNVIDQNKNIVIINNSKSQSTHYSSGTNYPIQQPQYKRMNITNQSLNIVPPTFLTLGNKLPFSYSMNTSHSINDNNTNSNRSYGQIKSNQSVANNGVMNKTGGSFKLIKIGNNNKFTKQNSLSISNKDNQIIQFHSSNDNSMNVCDLSSITKQNNFTFNSQMKNGQMINAFTPTQNYGGNYMTIENKSSDSGIDLLNKINQEILKSKNIQWQ